MRKFFRGHNYNIIDVKIGRMLSKLLFIKHDIKNIVTISQSFQSVFKGMFPNAQLFDYQHGLISSKYYGYIDGNSIAEHISINRPKILLYGMAFKERLLKTEGGNYFQKNAFVIGSIYKEYKKSKSSFNGKVLFTLQFTSSHTLELNQLLLLKTIDFFNQIKLMELKLTIYLKHHPRYDDCIDINELYAFNFVKNAPTSLEKCFEMCSLHLTEYSSVLFDSVIEGVPTFLTSFSKEMRIYQDEYNFPINEMPLLENLKIIEDKSHYQNTIDKQIKWSKNLYQPFEEKSFIDLLR